MSILRIIPENVRIKGAQNPRTCRHADIMEIDLETGATTVCTKCYAIVFECDDPECEGHHEYDNVDESEADIATSIFGGSPRTTLKQ